MEDLSIETIDRGGFSKFSVEISTGFIEIKVVQNVDLSGLHSQHVHERSECISHALYSVLRYSLFTLPLDVVLCQFHSASLNKQYLYFPLTTSCRALHKVL